MSSPASAATHCSWAEFVLALQDRLDDDRVSIRDVCLNPAVEKLAPTLGRTSPAVSDSKRWK